MDNILQYLGIFVLILFSAFFSAAEIAYASVNTLRLKSRLDKKKSLSATLALKIAENYNDSLGAILIGNNLVNIASSSLATLIVMRLLTEDYAWVATISMTLIILTFGEILPKVLAKQFCDKFSTAVSIPIYILTVALSPLIYVVMLIVKLVSHLWSGNESKSDSISTDDFENIIDIVEDEGVLDEEQCDLLQNALDFDTVLAYEVITPRVDIEALDIGDSYDKNLEKIFNSTYSRIPVYEDTPDHIIGVLHLNHFFKQLVDKKRVSIRKLLLPVTYVYKTMPLPDVLEKMRNAHSHLVVVLDEYGGTMGILTMEDVLEQLVGEIWDESDDIEREFVCIDETHFEAIGEMRIYDFFDEFDIDVDDDENFEGDDTTVGGWVVTMLDGEVHEGDTFKFENLIITVKEVDNMRLERIIVEELESNENKESDDD